jgi:hypothetical protein
LIYFLIIDNNSDTVEAMTEEHHGKDYIPLAKGPKADRYKRVREELE